jgi:hypothetical protein
VQHAALRSFLNKRQCMLTPFSRIAALLAFAVEGRDMKGAT